VVGRVSERVAGHYVYDVNVAISLASVRHQQDIIPYVCIKNLSLALLKIGISLPETC
jgi:hypothetical protein